MIVIREADTPDDISTAASLFEEYAASLDVDLGFQGFADELATLPGHYAAPQGALLLAWEGDIALGCVALRALEPPAIAELKRLYVRPAGRGQAIGSRLSQAAIARAKQIGYERIRLDTLSSMLAAQRLYESLGFYEIPPYRYNPVPDTRYLELLVQGV
ncbi:MAG: GNAT family N-acetyltransferase [Candidimonas sp.]|nr:MAG: GNAT family N-acetyltransferase [Candidimonas sp.]TAM25735.1 MAG: GNAT family N-acetyltransferase [Candidimonas sp.]TAM75341.1 MAG: GNAT family N-acetyltransferase [Candidimonas sp.]